MSSSVSVVCPVSSSVSVVCPVSSSVSVVCPVSVVSYVTGEWAMSVLVSVSGGVLCLKCGAHYQLPFAPDLPTFPSLLPVPSAAFQEATHAHGARHTPG